MTSLTEGASPGVPESLRYAAKQAPGQQVNVGRPELRWRNGRGLLTQALIGAFFTVARPLIAWQQRVEERDRLRRLPDYLLKDIGLERKGLETFTEISRPRR